MKQFLVVVVAVRGDVIGNGVALKLPVQSLLTTTFTSEPKSIRDQKT